MRTRPLLPMRPVKWDNVLVDGGYTGKPAVHLLGDGTCVHTFVVLPSLWSGRAP